MLACSFERGMDSNFNGATLVLAQANELSVTSVLSSLMQPSRLVGRRRPDIKPSSYSGDTLKVKQTVVVFHQSRKTFSVWFSYPKFFSAVFTSSRNV